MYHFPITVLMIGNRSAGIGDIVPNDKIIFLCTITEEQDPVCNTLELDNLSVEVRFTTSKPKLDFKCKKLGKQLKGSLLGQLLATESPLKVQKNRFYFTLKALFVLNFCSSISVMYKNSLIRKIRLISKFSIHILLKSQDKELIVFRIKKFLKFSSLAQCH